MAAGHFSDFNECTEVLVCFEKSPFPRTGGGLGFRWVRETSGDVLRWPTSTRQLDGGGNGGGGVPWPPGGRV